MAGWHPTTKLAGVGAGVLLAFVARPSAPESAWVPVGGLAAVAALAWAEGPAIRRAWARRCAVAILPIALAIGVMNGLFYPGGQTVLARLGPAALTVEGLTFAAVVVARLALIIGAVALAALTTTAAELSAALNDLGLPHPLPAFVPIVGGVLPGLLRRGADIVDAQRARGLALRRGPLPRPQAALALVVPLVGAVLEEIESRTRALEARGIGLAGPRTSLARVVDDPRQRAARRALLVAAAVALAVARWRR